jgi:hypothetical protein
MYIMWFLKTVLRLIRPAHTARRLSTRKRKYDVIASPNEAAQGQFNIFPSPLLVVNINVALANNQVAEDDKARPSQGALYLLKNG